MSAVNIHSPGEKCSTWSVNYTVQRELWGSTQPDPTVVEETIAQWLQSAFPTTICATLLTIKHLSITPRLQLLAPHATDFRVSRKGYCNSTLDRFGSFFVQCLFRWPWHMWAFFNARNLSEWSFVAVCCFGTFHKLMRSSYDYSNF